MNSQEFSAHLKKSFASLSQLKSFGVDVPLKLTDSLYVAQHQDEFRKVIQFFESAGGAKTVTFKANSIVIDGRGISGVDSAVYRTVLRSIYEQGMADRYHRKSGPIIEVRPDGKRIEISPDGTRRELS